MALFGSDIEKEIKKHAAQGEPAWKTAGKAAGIEVWRIEKFQVKPWPKAEYGKFFDGDSYIVLHTYKVENAFKYDVHFWLGQYTTLDEAGTAAYKTVELDDFLSGIPVQYREVQGHESEKFLHYFDKFIVQHGGIETGFKHVKPSEYRKRLLHVKGTSKNVIVREVPAHTSSLNKGDVFILDFGEKLYQFVGPKAGIAEKTKATQLARALDDERGSKVEIHVIGLDDKDDNAKIFWDFLGGKADIAETAGDDTKAHEGAKKRMFRVHAEGGKTSFNEVSFAKSSLASDDVFIVDVVNQIFIWCGKSSNAEEKKQGFTKAQEYLNQQKDRNSALPIVRVMEGGENEEFLASLQ
jgi:gelsolin